MNSRPGVRLVPRDAAAHDAAVRPETKFRRIDGREREHRDEGHCAATRVAPRDERGEVPD